MKVTSATWASEIRSPVSGSMTAPGYFTAVQASSAIEAIALSTARLRVMTTREPGPGLAAGGRPRRCFRRRSRRAPTRHRSAPASLAQPMASVTIFAAPRPEPALPARSRIPAITGAPSSVLMVVIDGDRPLRSTCLPAILECPVGRALLGVAVDRAQQ